MAGIPQSYSRSGWIGINLSLLTDLSGDAALREAEWLRAYRHYGPRLDAFFASRLPRRPELDALLADLWGRAFLSIHTVRSANAMWSWLTTIGNNLLRDGYRRELANREIPWTDVSSDERVQILIAGWNATSPAESEADDTAALLATLSEEEYEFLALYAIDGLSHAEIAERLGLASAAASRQRLRRLRLRFTGLADDK